jgi:hypothetical protein
LRFGRCAVIVRDVDEELISRREIEGLLFNVADIAAVLGRIELLLQEDDDDGTEEGDEGGA